MPRKKLTSNDVEMILSVAVELIDVGKVNIARGVLVGQYDPAQAHARWIRPRGKDPRENGPDVA